MPALPGLSSYGSIAKTNLFSLDSLVAANELAKLSDAGHNQLSTEIIVVVRAGRGPRDSS